MTTKQKIISELESKIRTCQERISQVESLGDRLDNLTLDAQVMDELIDFNNLSHVEIIEVIKAIGGKWTKTPSGTSDARIDYETTVNGIRLRCWAGEPPPNCKIVDVLVTIPAEPERVVTRKKLVCV